MLAFVNNEFLPIDRATLRVGDLAIQRGYGIFDFFRVQDHIPLYLDNYLDRFFRSAEIMHLQGILPREQVRSAIFELIERNNLADAGMKMILTGGYSPDAYLPTQANFIITQHPLTLPTPKQIERGVSIITHEYRRDLPAAKTINYTMGVWLQKEVKERLADDVLYHLGGEISEFPRSNFFLVTKEETLVTPSAHILHGITRMKVLQVARAYFKVEERSVTLTDLQNAKEAFMTSTTKRILPIVRVNESAVGEGKPGRITIQLMQSLAELEKQVIEKSLQSHIK